MTAIRDWLDGLGLGRFAAAFEREEIDLAAAPHLSDTMLKEMGLAIGPRAKLLAAAAALAAASPATAEAAAPQAAERRQITVMFCDLVGSTALSEALDPEELRTVMQAYQACCGDIIERYGGHVAQYLGDGLMTYFGWPAAHEDDAERAVRAALEIVAAVKGVEVRRPLAVRIGIETGAVVVGETGAGDASIPKLAVGETPNLAARLQALAAADQVVIGPTARRLAGGAFAVEALGEQRLHGIGEAVPAWRVVRAITAEARFDTAHEGALTPIVGRDEEVAILLRRWRLAAAGEGQLVMLSGEAGVGKSRIVHALRESIAGEPHTRLTYQCSPFHASSALYPFVQQLSHAAGIDEHDDDTRRLDKLGALLAQATDAVDAALPVFAALLAIAGEAAAAATAQAVKERTIAALVAQLEGLAGRQPVLVVFEDLHWIDPTSLDVLGLIVERLPQLPVLAIFSARPEYAPPWGGQAHVTTLMLNRLSQRLVATMIEPLCGGRALPESVLAQIAEKTDGVPLFVEELTRTVLESGLLHAVGDRWELDGPLPPLAIPATLRDSLMARLDRLAPVKQVAQTAAAIGREFDRTILAAVSPLDGSALDDALEQLSAAQLLVRRGTPSSPLYAFRHAMVQDVAYESLLKSERARIHSRIADAIEDRRPDIAAAQPETLARHLSAAGHGERAAAFWLAAGERAKASYANVEGIAHLRSGLAALDAAAVSEAAETRAVMMSMLGDFTSRVGDMEEANVWYEQALALAPDSESRNAIGNRLHRSRSVVRDGARIVYYEHGGGEETLLFVNPIVYGLTIFQPTLEELCQEFRIITVDCRGTGASDPLVRPYTLDQHAKDLAAVIETLGGGPITGVGISRGGTQLVKLTAAHPALIDRLVLVGCPVTRHEAGSRYGTAADFVAKRDAALAQKDVIRVLRIHTAHIFTEPETHDLAEQFLESGSRLPQETLLSFYDTDPGLDISALLPGITIPTLIVHGTEDRLIPFAAAEYAATTIADAELYPFVGKGHLPNFTATAEFCRVLRKFVHDKPVKETSNV